MEPKDLRIGNQTNLGTITGIYEGNGYMIQINNHSAYDIEKIEPIPLTEDWLLKFGFKNLKNERFVIGKLRAPTNWRYDLELFVDLKVSLDKNKYMFQSKEIKFVHQLQNLYFTLTGEELILK